MLRILFILAIFIPAGVQAETAIGGGIGTAGFNISLAQSLTDDINVRLGYNGASYDFDGETDGIDYEYGFDLSSFHGLVDWHFMGNGFRLTAGAMSNSNEVDASSKPFNGTVEVGDMTFTSAEVGRLEGDISFDSFAPYLGLGWGRAVGDGLGWLFDVGVAFQGDGDAELRAVDGTFSNNPILLDEIEREEAELEDDIDDFKLYPIISLQLFYTF